MSIVNLIENEFRRCYIWNFLGFECGHYFRERDVLFGIKKNFVKEFSLLDINR